MSGELMSYLWCPRRHPHRRVCVNKNFNLDHNFLTRSDMAFILHMRLPCDKTFHMVPQFLTLWPWPWSLTYFWKPLTLAIHIYDWNVVDCDVKQPIHLTSPWPQISYHKWWGFHIAHAYSLWEDLSHGTVIFDLVTLTLKFDLLLKNFNLGHNFLTTSDRAFIMHKSYDFLVTRPFTWNCKFWPHDLDLEVWPTFEKSLTLAAI